MTLGLFVLRAALFSIVAVLAVIAAGAGYQSWRTRRDRIDFPPPGRIVSIGPRRFHLLCIGNGSPTVVIDPGVGVWSTQWSLIQRELAAEVRVCTYDRAGLGWSDLSTSPHTALQAADELHETLSAAGERCPYLLVGESYGGYVARLFYDRYASEVTGMVLMESAHERQWDEIPKARALLEEAVPKLEIALWLSRVSFFRWKATDPGKDLPGDVRASFMAKQADTQTFQAILNEIDGVFASAEQVRKTQPLGSLPLVVVTAGHSFNKFVAAEKEPQLPQMNKKWLELQDELAHLSTNSIHLISPEATHGIAREQPAFVADAIRSALRLIRSQKRL